MEPESPTLSHPKTGSGPRVEPRALEILGSIREMFAAKGFDGASMQDLARAAGMSAGNFYRYFPSKNAIVEAMIEHEIDQIRSRFDEVMRADAPLDAIVEHIRRMITDENPCEVAINAEIHAIACRRPEVAHLLARLEGEVSRNLAIVFARTTGLPEPEAERRFGAHGRLIVFLVRSLSMRAAATGGTAAPARDPTLETLVLDTIQHTLDAIAAAATGAHQPERELS